MELSAGTRLGPYEIRRRVGAGGMGVVYGAVDSRLGRSVAIKVLPAELVADEDRLRRFEKEARTIGALNHPNLVTLHDVGHHDGAPFLVTELLIGTSLRSRLAQRTIGVRDAVRYAKEIARGLAAAHGAGVVHRDIKPDNIFITDDDRIKLLDFGIAKLRREPPPATDIASAPTLGETAATGTGVVIGTPGYMAPEQLTGAAVDARTDLFALGVVLYEMVARRRPFAADTNVEESYAIMKNPPAELPATTPAALTRVVLRCLEKRPDARFQTAADLAFALEALDGIRDSAPSLSGEAPASIGELATMPASTAPLPAGMTSTTARVTARRPRALLYVVAGLAVLALAGFAITKLLRPERPPAAPAVATALPFPSLPSGGPVYRRISFHSQHQWYARFAPDGRVWFSMANPDGSWEVTQAGAGHANPTPLGIYGRLLALSPTGELALLRKDGALVTQVVGAGARERAKDVRDADYAPDGRSLAIARFDGPTNIIEYPIGRELRRHDSYAFAHLKVSPDGKRLAFIEHDAFPDSRGRVVVIDTTNKEVASSQVYPGIEGVAWSIDGSEVWFSEASRLRALDLAGHDRVLLHSTLTLQLMDVARDGRLLFAPADYRIHSLVGQLGERPHDIGRFDSAVVHSLSRDGGVIAFLLGTGVGQTDDGYACYVSTDDGAPVSIGNGFQVVLTPDGKAAVVLSAKQTLQWQPLGAGTPRAIPTAGLELDLRARLQVTADGKRVIGLAGKRNELKQLWAFDLAGAPPVAFGPAIDKDVSDVRAFAVSPDAAWVAFPVGPAAPKPGVRLVATSGGSRIDIPLAVERTPLRFSADGKALFVIDYAPWPMPIERIDLATKTSKAVTHVGEGQRPSWLHAVMSDDTRSIAFSFPRKTSDLYVLEPPPK